MIRYGRWKYVHYVAYAPQLFDLDADPEELNDLGSDPAFAGAPPSTCRYPPVFLQT